MICINYNLTKYDFLGFDRLNMTFYDLFGIKKTTKYGFSGLTEFKIYTKISSIRVKIVVLSTFLTRWATLRRIAATHIYSRTRKTKAS
jgi:hypothetical protein